MFGGGDNNVRGMCFHPRTPQAHARAMITHLLLDPAHSRFQTKNTALPLSIIMCKTKNKKNKNIGDGMINEITMDQRNVCALRDGTAYHTTPW